MSKLGKSTTDFVKDLTKDMKRNDFTQELGFMHQVKEEVGGQ